MVGPMAVAVIFGLGISTLLTLILVPVLVSIVYGSGMEKGLSGQSC